MIFQVLVELLNWKLEQLEMVANKEKKVPKIDELNGKEKQKMFEIVFKPDETSGSSLSDMSLNSSINSSASAVTIEKQNITTKFDKLMAAKHFMQNVLGKFIIPVATLSLIVLYFIAVLAHCA